MEQWGSDPWGGAASTRTGGGETEMFRRPESSPVYFVIFALMVFAAVADVA